MALERLKKQVELSSEKAYAEMKLQVCHAHTLAHTRTHTHALKRNALHMLTGSSSR